MCNKLITLSPAKVVEEETIINKEVPVIVWFLNQYSIFFVNVVAPCFDWNTVKAVEGKICPGKDFLL